MEKIIKLKYPFDIDVDIEGIIKTITISELKLSRLKAKHLKILPPDFFSNLDNGIGFSKLLPIIASMNNLKVADLDELDMADISVIMDDIGNFF